MCCCGSPTTSRPTSRASARLTTTATPACSARWPAWGRSARGATRSSPWRSPGGVLVAVLLRQPGEAVGAGAQIGHVDVGMLGHRVAEQLTHGLVHGGDVVGLLRLGVGLVGDADHPVVAARDRVAKAAAADEPARGRDEIDDDGGQRRIFAEPAGGEVRGGCGHASGQCVVGFAGNLDMQVGHRGLRGWVDALTVGMQHLSEIAE
mmetsp:Transcript_657/g.1416  ORF Transcript_657/g.1416 Transcript_657/m.1416 type:complete len:206 (+) Transcript_657:1571-2188(+)